MERVTLAGLKSALLIATMFMANISRAADVKEVYWYVDGKKQSYQMDATQVVFQTTDADLSVMGYTSKNMDMLTADTYDGKKLVKLSAGAEMLSAVPGKMLIPLYAAGSAEPMLIDDRLIVVFKDPDFLNNGLNAFMSKYGLIWENPEIGSLPAGGNYPFLFRLENAGIANNAAMVSAMIYENEQGLVLSAQPNQVNAVKINGSPVDNPNFKKSWHLENSGQQLFCSQNKGASGADAGVTDAWNLGYTGQGITVAVIDVGGFDFNHPDLQGQLISGWDCINNKPYDASNYYFADPNQAHGINVAGIIGAKGDNVGATGVAYNARVVPMLINGSESSILIALQKCLEMNVDVINMSFGTGYSEAVKQQIENLVNLGRERYGNKLGTIIVASHGNDGYDDASKPQWPSAYPEVISVSSSTPDDARKETGDSWNVSNTWATNYGNMLDLAAPGVCIYTTDIVGSAGYSSTDYGGLQKTSASAPIVSGVAALLLSKNNGFTWQEVREKLIGGADKTGNGYNYDHDASRPGHSKEMGYGRVNAYKALASVPVGIGGAPVVADLDITVTNPVTGSLTVTRKTGNTEEDLQLAIFNLSGQLMTTRTLSRHENVINMDVAGFTPGMYITRFINNENAVLKTVKFIKL